MSGVFDEAISAVLSGVTVDHVWLVKANLSEGDLCLHTGIGTLKVGGAEYFGTGSVGAIGGLRQAIGGTAADVTFGFSGVDQRMIEIFRDDYDTGARGREISVSLQFLHVEGFKTLGAPYRCWTGYMGQPNYAYAMNDSVITADITVTAENIFVSRKKATNSLYTDRDQQARFPGDLGLEFVPTLINKTLYWPDL